MRQFGRQTIAIVSVTEDLGRDHYGNPTAIRTETSVSGCHFRPLPATETVKDSGQVVRDHWKATCPPVAAVVGATSRDEIKVDGVTYQIVGGPRVFADIAGKPFKVTVICERQDG